MSTKINFTIEKGNESGKSYSYNSKETLIIGRNDDCAIILPETTVSRYHCLIEIVPPSVIVRDFGSLNGTYLNGKKIGQRDKDVSASKAQNTRGEEFAMKSGDILGLGNGCELKLEVKLPQYCADCFEELDDTPHVNSKKLPICEKCNSKHLSVEQTKDSAEVHESEPDNDKDVQINDKSLCGVCGKPIEEDSNTSGICDSCRKHPENVVRFFAKKAQNKVRDVIEVEGYTNIKKLGEGGMSRVWLVEDDSNGEQIALKFLLPQADSNKNAKEIFLREAELSIQLNHSSIVRVFKFGFSGDVLYILMEECKGGSLDDFVSAKGGKLDVDLATDIILQVLDGLNYAHNEEIAVRLKDKTVNKIKGIVHRDLKPGNILLSGDSSKPVVKIADFGLAKAFEGAGLSGHTNTGQKAGTPAFMPRQQLLGYKYTKPESDVWAAAATYYYVLTGKFTKDYIRGRDAYSIALTEEAVPIRKRNKSIPSKLADVIDAALIERPEIGIKSAAELKKKIEGAL
jgi:serine/threonine-protein kinase